MRALQRLHVPTLMFVNKIDRAGADVDAVLRAIGTRLTPDLLPMGVPDGSRVPRGDLHGVPTRRRHLPRARDRRPRRARRRPARGVRRRAGAYAAAAALPSGRPDAGRRPAPGVRRLRGHRCGRPRADGRDRDLPAGRRLGPGRRTLGTGLQDRARAGGGEGRLRRGCSPAPFTPDSASTFPRAGVGKVTGVQVFEQGRWVRADEVGAGRIGRLHGLGAVRVGDGFGDSARAEAPPLRTADPRGDGRGGRPRAAPRPADGTRTARRPGPADRRAHRRGRSGDRLAVRAGPAGGARARRWPRSTASTWSSPTRACCTSSDPEASARRCSG